MYRFAALLLFLLQIIALPASAQIFDMGEMNTTAIAGLDLQKTVVIIPEGILEEHGPYLPSFSDGYQNAYLARQVAEAIVARPGWTVLMFPPIPLGDGGANQIAKKDVFPGSYHVHFSTLRAVFMDIASELGEAGFRHIFLISDHGAVQHHLALNEASDFFNDTYHGTMVHLTGLIADFPQPNLSNAEQAENGFDIHAGMGETSRLLFLRPDLVRPGYLNAVPQAGATWRDLINRGMQRDWPGYFGSPRLATAARGAESMRASAEELSKLALRILDGLDHRTLQRYSTQQLMDEAVRDWDAASAAHGRRIQEQQDSWLRSKGL